MVKKATSFIGNTLFVLTGFGMVLFHFYTMYCWMWYKGLLACILSFFFPVLSEIIMFFIAFDLHGVMSLYVLLAIGLIISYLVSVLLVAIGKEYD